jgi:hypothetical protein
MAKSVASKSRLENSCVRRHGLAQAVRNALAASAGLLALSGSVQAGTCVPGAPTAGDTVECDGVFTSEIFYAVDDLTLVVGSNDPATTITTVGENGIFLREYSGSSIHLTNYADITTEMAGAYANPIKVFAQGDVTVVNAGAVVENGSGEVYGAPSYYATAILVYSYAGDVDMLNAANGSITSYSEDLIPYGMVGRAYGSSSVINAGDMDVAADNNGAAGLLSIGEGGDAYALNSGVIHAEGAGAVRSLGMLALAYSGDATAINDGDIDVASSSANAQGMRASGAGLGMAVNHGDISAAAALDSSGVVATGTYAVLQNDGAVTASSAQNATALRSRAADTALLDNSGDASALAGDGFNAWALSTFSYYSAEASNSGAASAQVAGATGRATGALVQSLYGDAYLRNDGDISASGGAYAVGVELDAYGAGELVNFGAISASGGAVASYAVLGRVEDDRIENHGALDGAIGTGDGDDLLLNLPTGTWAASGSSLFGNGDDSIVNEGRIDLSDAFIGLGASTTGNQFDNSGTISAAGDNVLDMGGAFAFTNDGLLDFQDGAPDDVLAITGDFAGSGDINLDVSGLQGTSDLLYINGNVAPDSHSTVNVALLDLPAQDSGFDIPMIRVSGDSLADNFTLGAVDYQSGGLLDVGFSLVPALDATNASDDVYSLRMELLGLGATGAIAAAAAPGVQVLMQSVVGTLAQRNVSLGDAPPGRFSAWARVYRNRGTICPGQSSAVIGDAGDVCFDQTNSGGETGFDFAGNDKFSFGLLLGKAGADQKLQAGGARSELEGDVRGAFGTMRLPRGIYADLSHRRVDFDINLRTPAGPLATTGTAETTNAESGYKWQSRNGLVLEGQFQTMRTKLVSVGPVGSSVTFASKPDLSVVSRLGLSVTKHFKPGPSGTLWEVHANGNFIRESHAKNDYVIADDLKGSTDLSGNSTMIEVGFTGRRGLLLMFGGLTWQDGGALQNFIGGTLGAKYTW